MTYVEVQQCAASELHAEIALGINNFDSGKAKYFDSFEIPPTLPQIQEFL